MFTEAEMIFLSKRHRSNWAFLERRSLDRMPAAVRQRILEFRAKELGAEFTEFRAFINVEGKGLTLNAVNPPATLNTADLF